VDENVLAGLEGSEDAGVYRLAPDLALVQTVDFFTPIVDDPKTFGRAAATNSLSDVYAMGGRPLTAMNIVCFPTKRLGLAPLRAILEGGMEVVRDAGAVLVGGHSVEDDEPKYGLAVTGLVHPDRIMTNAGLEPGDRLILTKKVGTGVIATALKGGLASRSEIDEMVGVMCTLNRAASEVAVSFGTRACTDVTGFGLAGHLVEMAAASRCKILVHADRIPLLSGALQWASMGLLPGGAHANRKYFGAWIDIAPRLSLERVDLMFDPQTSGGLVLGVPKELAGKVLEALHQRGVSDASEIGEALEKDPVGRLEIA